jgi:hypothetical protein
MSLSGASLLTRVLTWGTLSTALSSAVWLSAAGDDDYPLRDWIEDLLGAQVGAASGSAAQAVAERARSVRLVLPERAPGLR